MLASLAGGREGLIDPVTLKYKWNAKSVGQIYRWCNCTETAELRQG